MSDKETSYSKVKKMLEGIVYTLGEKKPKVTSIPEQPPATIFLAPS